MAYATDVARPSWLEIARKKHPRSLHHTPKKLRSQQESPNVVCSDR
jgi:hypothetical protein